MNSGIDTQLIRLARITAMLILWSSSIVSGEERPPASLQGLVTRAESTGPRGTFVTEMVSLADGTTRFVQVYPPTDPRKRAPVELIVDSKGRAFERKANGKFTTAEPGTGSFVRGHDAVRLALGEGTRPSRLSLPAAAEMGGGTVTIELADYKKVLGFDVPSAATFVHSGAPNDRFVYRYAVLLPFRVAPGSPSPADMADPAALFARLGDLAEIAAAHERVMEAHRRSDAALLTADAADLSTVSGRGRLSEVKREEQVARMSEYLGAIRFSRYVDTVVPVIALSEDGSLAWLACEMEAEGIRTAEGKSEPIAYAFSWVEHYARGAPDAQGRRSWIAIGNASSLRP